MAGDVATAHGRAHDHRFRTTAAMSKTDSNAPGFTDKPSKPREDFPPFPHATERRAK